MRKLMINITKLAATTVLTVLAFKYAKIERGYDAIGGEALVLLLCWIVFYLAPGMAKEIKKAKGGNENEIR
nr:hypothetical protein [uncultured Leptotrichia sp.]